VAGVCAGFPAVEFGFPIDASVDSIAFHLSQTELLLIGIRLIGRVLKTYSGSVLGKK
jgi:hypothetical protein